MPTVANTGPDVSPHPDPTPDAPAPMPAAAPAPALGTHAHGSLGTGGGGRSRRLARLTALGLALDIPPVQLGGVLKVVVSACLGHPASSVRRHGP